METRPSYRQNLSASVDDPRERVVVMRAQLANIGQAVLIPPRHPGADHGAVIPSWETFSVFSGRRLSL